MKSFKFKELDIKPERNRIQQFVKSQQFKRTIVAILIGSVAGFLFFYFTEGQHMDRVSTGDIMNSLLLGGFFGFFITNSPCARGRC